MSNHASHRMRLPLERMGIVHRFLFGGQRFFLRTSCYQNGQLGEIFLEGGGDPNVSAMADAFATAVSIGLQHGVPLEVYAEKFSHTQFEPRGDTDNKELPRCSSILDYVFRFLMKKKTG